jgi:hypothetical protein
MACRANVSHYSLKHASLLTKRQVKSVKIFKGLATSRETF